jgi:uncharacterized protein CbrC (UPF0167 family)
MPCNDTDGCNESTSLNYTQVANHEQHSEEICTPFCVCSCCAAHFLKNDFQPELNQVAVINTVYTLHKESKTSAAIIPIWQPPKLA